MQSLLKRAVGFLTGGGVYATVVMVIIAGSLVGGLSAFVYKGWQRHKDDLRLEGRTACQAEWLTREAEITKAVLDKVKSDQDKLLEHAAAAERQRDEAEADKQRLEQQLAAFQSSSAPSGAPGRPDDVIDRLNSLAAAARGN